MQQHTKGVCGLNSHACLVRALGTSWHRVISRPSAAWLWLRPTTVGFTRLSCVLSVASQCGCDPLEAGKVGAGQQQTGGLEWLDMGVIQHRCSGINTCIQAVGACVREEVGNGV